MQTESEDIFSEASNLFDKGYVIEAYNLYSNFLKSHSEDVLALSCRAHASRYLKKYDEGIEDCRKSLRLNDTFVFTYLTLAELLYDKYDFYEAIKTLNKVFEIKKAKADEIIFAYRLRGDCWRHLEEHIDAILDYNIVIEENNIVIDCYGEEELSRVYVNRAVSKNKLGDFIGSIQDYNMSIEIKPAQYKAHTGRALAKFNVGYYSEAIEDCFEAIKIDATITMAFEYLGDFYFKWKHEVEKSICCLRIALELKQKNDNLKLPNADSITTTYSELLMQTANYYLEWEEKKAISQSFLNLLKTYSLIKIEEFIDDEAFANRIKIANGYYSRAFIDLMPFIGTHLYDDNLYYCLYLFIGNPEYILNPILNKEFFFGDAQKFSDKSDCLLLNPITNNNIPISISYRNVRVACFCNIEEDYGINKCLTMWDRYSKGHTGVAYKFKIYKEWIINNIIYLNKVNYISSQNKNYSNSPEQAIENGLFTKNLDYSDEKEWRMIKFGVFKEMDSLMIPWLYNDKIGVEIEAVYIGAYMPEIMQDKIIELALDRNLNLYKMKFTEDGNLNSNKIPV